VIGCGASADVVFAPQHFPNPARPNNVIAPFWTDLQVIDGAPGPADGIFAEHEGSSVDYAVNLWWHTFD